MNAINHFEKLTRELSARGVRKRVAVVCPDDESTCEALDIMAQHDFVEPIRVEDADPAAAARKAIRLIREGKADILMKGLVKTDVLLHEILDKNEGLLEPGRLLTHIAAASIPGYHKLLFFTDAAVIPFPTQEQREQQVRYIVELCHRFGIATPRVSLIHASEKTDERHFPYTAGYKVIKDMALSGAFGACVVDGPLDVKTSCDRHALEVKGIQSPIDGDADALVFPNIEAGNAFYKALTLFGGATTAGLLCGTSVPVVLPSRGDTPDTKFYSIALACII